jgi:hypothetical protein
MANTRMQSTASGFAEPVAHQHNVHSAATGPSPLLLELRRLTREHKVPQGGWYRPTTIPGRPDLLMLADGEIVVAPLERPSDVTTCAFVGYVPPKCSFNTGAFRRLYNGVNGTSNSGAASYMEDQFTPPSRNSLRPSTGPVSAVAYLYVEGWPLASIDTSASPVNSEAGFQYSTANNWYTPYMKVTPISGGAPQFWEGTENFKAAALVVNVAGYSASTCANTNYPCVQASFGGDCATASPCFQGHEFPSPHWSSSGCCVLASMVTIGESSDDFTSGFSLGPIDQLACIAISEALACKTNLITGNQRWPNNASKVIVTPTTTVGKETDEIDLN